MDEETLEPEWVIPDKLNPEQWEKETVLVLGAPYLGKTHLFREVQGDGITRVETLIEALEAPSSDFVVLDEFYTAYRGATTGRQQEFSAWLPERDGVCLSTRPRALDWLLNQDETCLTKDILDAFDSAYFLGYDPSDDDDRERAIERCLEIGGDDAADGVDRDAVEAHLDDVLCHQPYEFDNTDLQESLGVEEYGATLVPTIVVYASDQLHDESGALVSGSVRDAVKNVGTEFVENASLSYLITSIDEACSDLFSRETLSAVTSELSESDALASSALVGLGTALGPDAAASGGALALWLYLRNSEDGLEREELLAVLIGDELTPTAAAELEAALDLPPRTIENFQRLMQGNAVEQLLNYRNRANTELEAVGAHLDDVESTLNEYESDLEALEATVARLDEEVVEADAVSPFVSAAISDATGGVKEFGAHIRRDERHLLQTSEIKRGIPYYGTEDEDICELITEDNANLIILRGSHGTGKTTAGYRACHILSQSGYDVRLPHLDGSSVEFIERGMTATTDETVVFAFYKRGLSGDSAIRNERDLKTVLQWLVDGTCSTVILECRDELYTSLQGQTTLFDEAELKSRFGNAKEVCFEPLEDYAYIRSMVEWVLDEFDREDDRELIVEQTTDIAAGNPEIAKIAARLAVTDHKSLSDIDTMDELVWQDIDSVFSNESVIVNGTSVGGDVFEYVCAAREVETHELTTLLHGKVTSSDLEECAQYLFGYLGGDIHTERVPEYLQSRADDDLDINLSETDVWTVVPDIYGEVVFRKRGIEDGRASGYVTDFAALETDTRYFGLAENLALAYANASEWNDEEFQRRVTRYSNGFLDELPDHDVTPRTYVRCFEPLIFDGIPIHPPKVQKHAGTLVEGTLAIAADSDVNPAMLMMNYLSRLAASHCEFGDTEQITTVGSVAITFAERYSDRGEMDATTFLENVYSMVVSNWALTYPDPEVDHVQAWLDELIASATITANSDAHTTDAATFLENIYSMAVKQLADTYPDPEADHVQAWLDELFTRAITTATSDDQADDAWLFLANLYSMVMSNLADTYPHTESDHVQAWLDELIARATTTANSDVYETDAATFLENIYSIAVKQLAYTYSDPQANHVQAWLDELIARATTTANSNHQPNDSREFLANVCSLTVKELADTYPDPEADHVQTWLDELIARATTTAMSGDHTTDSATFLENIYSMAVKQLADTYPDPEADHVQAWLDELIARATTTATRKDRDAVARQFLVNFYSMAMNQLADMYPDPEADRIQTWLDELIARATTTAISEDPSDDAWLFLANLYSMAVKKLADTYPDPEADHVQAWLDELTARAITTAASDAIGANPATFLEHLYGIAVKQLADTYPDPEADHVQAWLDELIARAITTANSNNHPDEAGMFLINVYSMGLLPPADGHSGPESDRVQAWLDELTARATTTANSNHHDIFAGKFLAYTYSMAIVQALTSDVIDNRSKIAWQRTLILRVVGEFDSDHLPFFFNASYFVFEKMNGHPLQQIQKFAVVALEAAAADDASLGETRSVRVERVSRFVANAIHSTWQETHLDGPYFEEIERAIKQIETKNPELHGRLIEEVPKYLEETHCNFVAVLDWEETFE